MALTLDGTTGISTPGVVNSGSDHHRGNPWRYREL
jgi:hypothetical protein